jgi:hypothetical protein
MTKLSKISGIFENIVDKNVIENMIKVSKENK